MTYTSILKLSVAALVLSSCASTDGREASSDYRPPRVTAKTQVQAAAVPASRSGAIVSTELSTEESTSEEVGDLRFDTVPRIGTRREPELDLSELYPPLPSEDQEVSLSASQTIPEFIDVVFGDILGTGYSLGPGVEANPGVINLRTPSEMSPSALYDTAVNTLKLHAISVAYEQGEVKIYADSELKDSSPRFIPSRARSSVPAGLQPIVQYVEIYARELNDMANILKDAFPDANDLTVRVNRTSNSLTIAGLPQQTAEALRIIEEMDELGYADTEYAVYSSVNWDAEDLAQALEELLTLNGLRVSSQRGVTASVNIKPVPYTQQIYIFARRPDFLDLAVKTVRMLDTDATPKNVRQTRVYKAKYYKAEDLVAVLESVSQAKTGIGRQPGSANNASQSPGQASPDVNAVSQTANFVVDAQGNRVIFEATNDEYAETLRLLNRIDVPASEVLIEVTIAEVTLTDDNQYGMEFLFNQLGSRGFAVGFGTGGGLGLGDGGFSGSFQSGDYVLDFSALATNQQVNVLSTPRLVTKSGSSANIQVGTDVPIIVSQSAGNSQTGGSTDILQTVQYRETGVLLDITPLVLSNDRIDLTISQEVSAAEANANQAIASPLITNRSLNTELTLQDGQSAILGGLIENRYTRSENGVPILKDIPILGQAFSTETLNSTQTVLMVMITPYVLNSREDRAEVVNSFTEIVNRAYQNQVDESQTLNKPKTPWQIEPAQSAPQSLGHVTGAPDVAETDYLNRSDTADVEDDTIGDDS